MSEFFFSNRRGDTGEDMRWDAFKATMRGELIAPKAQRDKQLQALETRLETEVEEARTRVAEVLSRQNQREYRRAEGQRSQRRKYME